MHTPCHGALTMWTQKRPLDYPIIEHFLCHADSDAGLRSNFGDQIEALARAAEDRKFAEREENRLRARNKRREAKGLPPIVRQDDTAPEAFTALPFLGRRTQAPETGAQVFHPPHTGTEELYNRDPSRLHFWGPSPGDPLRSYADPLGCDGDCVLSYDPYTSAQCDFGGKGTFSQARIATRVWRRLSAGSRKLLAWHYLGLPVELSYEVRAAATEYFGELAAAAMWPQLHTQAAYHDFASRLLRATGDGAQPDDVLAFVKGHISKLLAEAHEEWDVLEAEASA